MSSILIWASGGALVALTCAGFLIATKAQHGKFSLDSTIGVQKFHQLPTPRIGGLAVLLGIAFLAWTAATEEKFFLLTLLAAGTPAFMAGLVEDLTKTVPVRVRLAATLISGVLAWGLTDVALTRVNVVGLDWVLTNFLLFAVLLTTFAVGGATNAFNIIDGFNGLAGGVAIISLLALGYIASQVGDSVILRMCIGIGAVVLGFMLLNFPFGKIFLGDGGAYLVGFSVAWIAILLPMRNTDVSVWATLLACAYPIIETLFSIERKLRRRGHHPGQPDHLHLHMLVHMRVVKQRWPATSATARNSLTSPLIWLYAALPAILAAFLYRETIVLACAFVFTAYVYRTIYLRLTRFRWRV